MTLDRHEPVIRVRLAAGLDGNEAGAVVMLTSGLPGRKRTGGPRPALQRPAKTKSWSPLRLGGLCFDNVVRHREARLVTVGGVLVQHALGYGLVDCRASGMKKFTCQGGVAGRVGGAKDADGS